jgi:ketosteroid isomerase-like protein
MTLTTDARDRLVADFLDAWNSQDVERVLDCYTDDVRYRDPNTRGEVARNEVYFDRSALMPATGAAVR